MPLTRSSRGATLALVAMVIVIVAAVGLFAIAMIKMYGGSRELANATDAGSLNLAKQATKKLSVQLNNGIEQDNFGGLAESDGSVNLLNFNRLMAQSVIVAANAQSEGTDQAKQNTQQLVSALQSADSSIAKRILTAAGSASQGPSQAIADSFNSVASQNSTRMLEGSKLSVESQQPFSGQYEIAFVDKGQPSNVYIDPNILPTSLPSEALTNVQAPAGKKYMSGYTDIKFEGMPAIAGVTVHPQQQPHLLAERDFKSAIGPTNLSAGVVPPNAFRSSAQVEGGKAATLANVSYSTVGALNADYQACIPRGYIVIKNPTGYNFTGQLPNPDSIYNNQLYSGIYMASNGAFSTDRDAIEAWVTYNNNPNSGATQPSLNNIFNSNGDPLGLSDAHGITSLGGGANNYPVEADYTMASGEGAIACIVTMVPSFEKAYDASNGQSSGNSLALTAVEDLKGQVMNLFATQGTGTVPAPLGYSGLRLFNHNQAYPVGAGEPPLITESGTAVQLLNQVNDTAIVPMMKQRIREIKPDVSDAEIDHLLQSNIIGLGETWYIYRDQANGNLTMSRTAPTWVGSLPQNYKDGVAADGNSIDSSVVYQTIGLSVDPQGESGFNSDLYDVTSDPSTTGLGQDEAIFTPSSGFNNLLGTLEFRQSITSVLAAYTPPTVDTPPTPPTPPDPPVIDTPVTDDPHHPCSCACSYPWDAEASALSPNATMLDVVAVINKYNYQAYTPTMSVRVDHRTYTFTGADYFSPASCAFVLGGINSGVEADYMALMAGGGVPIYTDTENFSNAVDETPTNQYNAVVAAESVAGSGPSFLAWYDSILCDPSQISLTTWN